MFENNEIKINGEKYLSVTNWDDVHLRPQLIWYPELNEWSKMERDKKEEDTRGRRWSLKWSVTSGEKGG